MSNGDNTDGTCTGWDFFVSYTQTDRPWAEWIAWALEKTSYRVLIQAWDFSPKSNWVTGMDECVTRATRAIAVLSSAYTRSVYGAAEWQAVWKADPTGATRNLLVARVENCPRPGLLGQVVSFDLFGLPPDGARSTLRDVARLAITGARAKPATPPPFPAPDRHEQATTSSLAASSSVRIGNVTAPGGQVVGIVHGSMIQNRGSSGA